MPCSKAANGVDMHYEIIEESVAFKGFFSLLKYRLKHTLYKGGWSEVISRELFHRGDCVAVIPYDPILDRVILIEQFRIGAIKTSPVPWLWEIVAGAIEAGETPETVAHRETFEEAGCLIRELIRIGRFYPTPGGCSETITLFCALVDARDAEGIYGLAEEHEDIRASSLSFDEAMQWLESEKIAAAAPIIGLQWLALNREKLRNHHAG